MLQFKGYELLNNIGGDEDVLDSFLDGGGSEYICDRMSDLASESVSIYNSNLWSNAPYIEEYIEEAIEQFGIESSGFSLTDLFQKGEYMYYSRLLEDNVEAIIYNWGVQFINMLESEMAKDWEVDELSLSVIRNINEDVLEEVLCDIDQDNRFFDIEDAIHDYIQDKVDEVEAEKENEKGE